MNPAYLITTSSGAILCDTTRATQVEERWFDPEYWRSRDAQEVRGSGRGTTWFVELPSGDGVLRHYRRGGMVARLLGDRYWWSGAENTRAFAEWRLLAMMRDRGLPVPDPIAARYVRHGWYYRADLITGRIADSQTLAQWLGAGRVDASLMRRVGSTIADFHAARVFHADLNAHNVMVSEERIHLLDFDRGALRAPGGGWQRANLARLHRSLQKLSAHATPGHALPESLWRDLLNAYTARLNVEADAPGVPR
ncbi:MAG: 3-deoxy-D-manno-octulosonic acid kinase [Tahibacter sp.]